MFGKILLGLAVTAILIITIDNNIKLSLLSINNNLNSKKMSQELDQLTADITDLGTVEDSVLAFLSGIESQLNDAKNDPKKISQLSLDIRAQKEKLAAAIVANTPAATDTTASTDTSASGTGSGSADQGSAAGDTAGDAGTATGTGSGDASSSDNASGDTAGAGTV